MFLGISTSLILKIGKPVYKEPCTAPAGTSELLPTCRDCQQLVKVQTHLLHTKHLPFEWKSQRVTSQQTACCPCFKDQLFHLSRHLLHLDKPNKFKHQEMCIASLRDITNSICRQYLQILIIQVALVWVSHWSIKAQCNWQFSSRAVKSIQFIPGMYLSVSIGFHYSKVLQVKIWFSNGYINNHFCIHGQDCHIGF